MANYMPEVAKMLGVELGDKFRIKNLNGEIMGTAIIDECGFKLLEYNVNYTNSCFQYALENLLTGEYIIERKPWKPKDDEEYQLVNHCGDVISLSWIDNFLCITNYKIGNCYRTKEEAEANRDKWIAFYASDKVLNVK